MDEPKDYIYPSEEYVERSHPSTVSIQWLAIVYVDECVAFTKAMFGSPKIAKFIFCMIILGGLILSLRCYLYILETKRLEEQADAYQAKYLLVQRRKEEVR